MELRVLFSLLLLVSSACGNSRGGGRRPTDAGSTPDGAAPSDAETIGDQDASTEDGAAPDVNRISFTLNDGSTPLTRDNLGITICQTPGPTGAWQVTGSDPLYDLRVAIIAYDGPGTYSGTTLSDVIVELGSYASGEFNYADNEVDPCEVTVDASEASAEVSCARLLWADESLAGQLTATLRCSSTGS